MAKIPLTQILQEYETRLRGVVASAKVGCAEQRVLDLARAQVELIRARIAVLEYGPMGERPWLAAYEAKLTTELDNAASAVASLGHGWFVAQVNEANL